MIELEMIDEGRDETVNIRVEERCSRCGKMFVATAALTQKAILSAKLDLVDFWKLHCEVTAWMAMRNHLCAGPRRRKRRRAEEQKRRAA